MCNDCAAQVGAIADMALRIGLLLRGGFSFGQLYHRGGVVFGEAMVDVPFGMRRRKNAEGRSIKSDRVERD